jgi:TfoX/Sxy family transcriptional regulator of competence genes
MPVRKKKQKRPRMAHASDEMKQWSALLSRELSELPQVSSRPMFGLRGFYRRKKIFAALPVSRAIGSANAFIFKIEAMSHELLERATGESRINSERALPGARWLSFELNSETDLRDALWWLNHAYEAAKN